MKLVTQRYDVGWTVIKRKDEAGNDYFVATVYDDVDAVHQVSRCSTAQEAKEYVLSYLKSMVWDLDQKAEL